MKDNRRIIHIVFVTFIITVQTVQGHADRNNILAGRRLWQINKFTERQAEPKNTMRKPQNDQNSKKEGAPVGNWGGEHISLEITEGGGSVEFDCAHGTIDQKMVPDKQGGFDVLGTYTEEHGGPIRKNEQTRRYAVRYTGQIKGKNMKITVRRVDRKKSIGTFALVAGQEAMLMKCK